ncbi:MAG: FHA domain-containing protein, partial [Chloroflexi bacterium]|nr:FHA domain-containing protein [Chloroflexota bacterium]
MMSPDWQQPPAPAAPGLAAMVLSRSVLFAGWSADALAFAAARFVPRAIPSGALLCRQGDPGDEMFVVERGRFAVDAVISGRSVRFAELGAGAVVGEIAVLTQQPRSATVTALVDGHVWALHRSDFDLLAAQFQGLEQAANRLAAERIAQQQGSPLPPASTGWPPANPWEGGPGPGHYSSDGWARPGEQAPTGGPAAGGPPSWGGQTIAGQAFGAGSPFRDGGAPLANEPIALALQPTQDVVTIGRDDGNDLVLRDPRVSRRHALVRRLGQTFRVEDLGSTNGIFVNGRRVDRADLRPGDLIQVGAQSLRFDPAVLTQYARGRGAQVDAVGLSRLVG